MPLSSGRRRILQHVAHRARLERLEDPGAVRDQVRITTAVPGVAPTDAPRGGDAVRPRHLQVHQHDVGAVLVDRVHGLVGPGGRGDDLDASC